MSRWFKADLQIASPAGGFSLPGAQLSTPEGRAAAVHDYVKLIAESGIEVFAVTDHNAMDMLDEIRIEAQAQGLTLFPGMELSTGTGSDGVHLLLLGDPEADIVQLKFNWMKAAGFDHNHPPFVPGGLHAPSPRSVIDILEDLPLDTIAIAPHILNDNGMANGASIQNGTIRWQCLHHDRLEAVDVGIPGGSTGFNKGFRERTLSNYPVVQRMAYVSTSDAYEPSGLGRFSYIRLNKPDLVSLRQALLDYEARIFCDWDPRLMGSDPNVVKHGRLQSIKITGMSTSKDPLEIEFDPRISVIIGSRGSGKSTIVQALRAVYGADSNLPKAVGDESRKYQTEVFAGATIESTFVESISGAADTATWTSSKGTTTAGGNELINVRIVTQKELFERTSGERPGAQSPSANMLALVDEAMDDDRVAAELKRSGEDVVGVKVDQFRLDLEDVNREYGQAALARLEADRKIAGKKRAQEGLGGVNRKLAALDDEKEKEKLVDAEVLLQDRKLIIDFLARAVQWAHDARETAPPEEPTLSTGVARIFLAPVRDAVSDASAAIDKSVASLDTTLSKASLDLVAAEDAFAKEVARSESIRTAYAAKLEELGVDLSQYESLVDEREGYKTELVTISSVEKELETLTSRESDAWNAIDRLFQRRVAVRDAFTRMVTSRTPSLRFVISAYGDPTNWKQSIHQALGFRTGDHLESLASLAVWIWGGGHAVEGRLDRLAIWRDSLLRNDYSDLAGAKLSSAFIARLRQATDAARIEIATLRADDSLEMDFLKEGNDPGVDTSWQSVTDGSPGQRSAAMLAFTLSYGDSPLVLDQPEDDLDSALVSELIVKQFRQARWKRQLIVVTHEANVPVNTDAERVVVLENVGGSLRVVESDEGKHIGPIDKDDVRKDIQNLLEGGVRAFVNRERRYDNELSKYRVDAGLSSH